MKRTLLLVAVLGLFVVVISHAVAAEPKAEPKAEANNVTEASQKEITALEQRYFDDRTRFFVGFGTLSFINAGLAQGKGRSGLLWWLASVFLGPFATFLIVVLDKVESKPIVLPPHLDSSKV